MEEALERFFEKCKQSHKPNEISEILSDFQVECRKWLENGISKIGLSKAQESAAKLLCQCWSFPVKWKLTAKPTVISSQNGEITMRVSYSICIQQSVDKIASLINEAIKQIRIIALDGNMLFTSPFEILRWAQNSLKKIHNAFPNTEIEKMFSDLLGDNFGAKFVYFDSDYATNEYFDFFESNSIEIPKTTVPAIVLQSNKECLLKGTHLIPIQYP